jgi:hypothetical protein
MVCVLSPVMDSISEDIFTGTIARVGITTTIFVGHHPAVAKSTSTKSNGSTHKQQKLRQHYHSHHNRDSNNQQPQPIITSFPCPHQILN